MPPARPIENVWHYPRPPSLQRTPARLRVIWRDAKSGAETTLADTVEGYRVLETSHPPTYYFPPSSVRMDLLRPSAARRTYCEWKGRAAYHDVVKPQGGNADDAGDAGVKGRVVAQGRAWSYPEPTPAFAAIKDYLCFYCSSRSDAATVGEWHCFVDEDRATAQEGDFYGSWVTPEITGGERGFKGGAGTWGW